MCCYAGIKGVVFSHDLLFCWQYQSSWHIATSLPRNSMVVASLNPAYSFAIRFREGCPGELAHSPSYSKKALDMGRVLLKAFMCYSSQV